jgi:hypothetical protein
MQQQTAGETRPFFWDRMESRKITKDGRHRGHPASESRSGVVRTGRSRRLLRESPLRPLFPVVSCRSSNTARRERAEHGPPGQLNPDFANGYKK